MLAFGMFANQAELVSLNGRPTVDPSVILGIIAATMGLMVLASLYRSGTLSRGGGQVARMLGAVQIQGDDQDPAHRRLINVVEEMAIASGLGVPEIYVLEEEPGINAFAAGLTHTDAAVAVTRGALERLDRAELQGVIAHEFSHILNGDMRLNQRLIGFSFGILVLSLIGRWLLRGSRRMHFRRGKGNAGVLIGLGLVIIGSIGVFFTRIIKAAVSRQRETLADASAVQFTREPTALAGALKKIGGYTAHLSSVETEEVSHMLFGRGASSFRGWFATHPPLNERIQALDPSFKAGDFPESPERLPEPAYDAPLVSSLAATQTVATPELSSAGTMESSATGAALRAAIPEELYHAAHSSDSSLLLVLALAVAEDPAVCEQQLNIIESQLGHQRANRCRRLRLQLSELERGLWLPLLELAAPALKQRPKEQIQFLFELIEKLSVIGTGTELFEYVLQRMLRTHFEELRGAIETPTARKSQKQTVEQALLTLIATIAVHGHTDETATRDAFRAGLETLRRKTLPNADETLARCQADRTLQPLDEALERLARLSSGSRRQTLVAVLATVRHDHQVTVAEAELFRAIAATLGCPIPPARTIS